MKDDNDIMYNHDYNFTVSFFIDLLMLAFLRGSPRPSVRLPVLERLCSSSTNDAPTSVNVHEHKLSRPTKAKPRVRVRENAR